MSDGTTSTSDEFIKMLSEIAEVPEEKIHPHSAIKADLDVDSLAVVELFTATETRWGIKIPDEEAKKLTTVGEVVDYIQRKT